MNCENNDSSQVYRHLGFLKKLIKTLYTTKKNWKEIKMKKQILTIISLILTIGMILPTANAEETSTYSDYVVEGQSTYADSFGLMKGYDDGTFKPDNNMTRAEFTSALMRAAVIANPDAQLSRNQFF